ncbi:MAG: PilZ domain-containing protein [Deltaproteobacteria bacterium]|nr:PilZ domain-containing protein [Deltaproteobacteria bacterium]
MADSRDSRRHPRIRVRVPNSLRIRVQDGDCLADLLDISQSGVGVEFFDLFDVLIFTEGDVVKLQFLLKPEQVADKSASEILEMIKGQKTTDEKGTETTETSGSGEEVFETDAKIVWTYLNRLGLEFVS